MKPEMTVAELKEQLEGLDDDAKVHLHCSGAFCNLRSVSQDDITWNNGKEETVVSLR